MIVAGVMIAGSFLVLGVERAGAFAITGLVWGSILFALSSGFTPAPEGGIFAMSRRWRSW